MKQQCTFSRNLTSHRAVLVCLSFVAMLGLTPVVSAEPPKAIPATEFLDSIGINSTFPDRGEPLDKTIGMLKYGGFHWVRGGIEGLTDSGPTTLQTYLDMHQQTGVRFSWGLGSGSSNLPKLLATSKTIAAAGALLAFEGNNEPNNWGITYNGEVGAGKNGATWLPVAKILRDLYKSVKGDPDLAKYPVWSISENGAENDNVGLQFLTIPAGAKALMPDGTQFADAANVHNYIYHPKAPDPADNKTWNASDPGPGCKVDGLYGNYGHTWYKKFKGYSVAELQTLPRVTTETGTTIGAKITEEMQALNTLSMYLDQFKRGFSYTSPYILSDRTDESGNQSYGLFKKDYTPRKAAVYLHNFTAILADSGKVATAGQLDYTIAHEPVTVHDMLLQHSDGAFQLIVWDERLKGTDKVTVSFGAPHAAVTIYDPTIGTDAVKTYNHVSSLDLVLSNHPLILTIPN